MAYQDRSMAARDIAARINGLNRERRYVAPRELMRELRTIRGLSQVAELRAVAGLAHALECELIACGEEAPIRAYLDRMHDAVEVVHDDQPRFIALALATLGTRMALA
ncbi:MAG: hypothetical protein Q7J32_07695 [Sphingomonadaceae bacterium]|nr:hypothetical protein [Sphingomonadaceae bacterium]